MRAATWCLALTALCILTSCGLPSVRVVKDPLTVEEHLMLGVAYEKRGEFVDAIHQYELAREGGLVGRAELYLGNAWLGRGDVSEAEAHYRGALESDPECHQAMNNLAWLIAMRDGDLVEAEELARHALAIAELSGNESGMAEYRHTLATIMSKKQEK